MPLKCFFVLFEDIKEENNFLVSVDIEGNTKNMELINLSQFTDIIALFHLRPKEIITYSRKNLLVFRKTGFWLKRFEGCQLYDSKGNFNFKVAQPDKGESFHINTMGARILKTYYRLMKNKTDLAYEGVKVIYNS